MNVSIKALFSYAHGVECCYSSGSICPALSILPYEDSKKD